MLMTASFCIVQRLYALRYDDYQRRADEHACAKCCEELERSR